MERELKNIVKLCIINKEYKKDDNRISTIYRF